MVPVSAPLEQQHLYITNNSQVIGTPHYSGSSVDSTAKRFERCFRELSGAILGLTQLNVGHLKWQVVKNVPVSGLS